MKRLVTGVLFAAMVALSACSGTPTQSQETTDSTMMNDGTMMNDTGSMMRTDTSMMQMDTTRRDSL
jgi:Flp pilus assembly protein TadD